MDAVPAKGWQVIEDGDGLTVLLSGASEEVHDAALAEKITLQLAAQGASVASVQVRRVPVIPPTAAGKTPLVKSNLPRRN